MPASAPTSSFVSLSRSFALAALNRALISSGGLTHDSLEHASIEFDDAAAALENRGVPEELAGVDRLLHLGADELRLLAFLAAAEFEPEVGDLLAALHGDRDRIRLEVGRLGGLLDLPVSVVAPHSRLQRSALVQLGPQTVASRVSVQLAPRVAWALLGDQVPDRGLETTWSWLLGDPEAADGWHRLLVSGGDLMRRRQAALANLGMPGVLVTAPPASDDGWAAVLREAALAGCGVLLETDAPFTAAAARWVEYATVVPIAVSSPLGLPLASLPHVDWREIEGGTDLPGTEEWQFVVGDVPQRHPLTATQLDLMRRALQLTGGAEDAAFRRLTDARMDKLATKIRPSATWDDLVLSPGRTGQLRDLINRYRHASTVYDTWGFNASPSRGVVALFSGPSGTGKTLSAEVVAHELGLDLYRLDLSSVVSKYIGETEKNLDELFDAASIGNTVLFFDEADSLFGKRTEVSDARDRYANVETSYLLQRLERYDGLVVLATNYEKNIDQAFLRRVHTRVAFSTPTPEERRELWRHNLHRNLEVAGDIDIDWLVETFELTGAAIRNAVLDAAFLAAAEGSELAMRHLVRGVAREMGKVSRVITASQFGPWYEAAIAHTE